MHCEKKKKENKQKEAIFKKDREQKIEEDEAKLF